MASGTAWPAALGDTLGRSATPLLWPGLKPLNARVGDEALLPGAGDDVHEVALEVSRTSVKYRLHLRTAYSWFVRWAQSSKWAHRDWVDDPAVTSQMLCEHVQWLKETGRPISNARHSILSVQTYHRSLKGRLGRPWDCIKSWQLERPLKSRIPLPSVMLTGFFLYAIAAALGATLDSDVHMYFSFAVLCRLGHHCLLRPAEIMKLVVADLRLPRASFEPELIVIRLRDPKNRSSLGRFQFAMCRDPALVAWICWYVRDCPPDMPLWPGKQARFSKVFREIRDRLGWARIPVTPGCLRPGGATEQFKQGATISVLKYAGRWKQEGSLEVYIQEAMSHLCMCELSEPEFDALACLITSGSAQWSQPPSSPAHFFFQRRAQWRGIHSMRARAAQVHRSQGPSALLSTRP